MRKFYAFLLSSLLPLPVLSQAPTEAQPMGSLVEDFTGISCPNCPDAHEVMARLQLLHPGLVAPVCLHAGPYASAKGDMPDFVTDQSTALHDFYGPSGYPSGMVNRHDYGYGLVANRSDWYPSTWRAARGEAGVNLSLSARYADGTLVVDVDGYARRDFPEATLTVYVLQNDIVGLQAGSGVGEDYHHLHVFRQALPETWGEPLGALTGGARFSRQYTWAVPGTINNTPVVPRDLEVVAFVSARPRADVVGLAGALPSGVERPLRVRMYQGLIPIEKTYAFNYIEAYLQNAGDETVQSVTFRVTLNGESHDATWTGTLAPLTTQLVHIPLTPDWTAARDNESNTYKVALLTANGTEQEGEFKFSGKFHELPEYPASMRFKVRTDTCAADNTFRLLDADGQTVQEFGPYADGRVGEYEEAVQLAPGRVYCLEIADRGGDGIYAPRGQVQLTRDDGSLVVQYKEIRYCGFRQFFRTAAQSDAVGRVAAESATAPLYDLLGRRAGTHTRGITVGPDGSKRLHTR